MAADFEEREPRTTTVTVLFCDLVASTERVQLVGDDEADHFRRAFFDCMREAAAATHGEVVKNTGDGVMVVFRDSAVSAVTCAATMHDKVEALDVDPPAFVRIGVSAGEVAFEHGDYFGTPVVEAARLCAAAEPGQTLVSDVVRVLVGSRGGHMFRSVGSLTLKGLTEPLASAALVRTPVAAPRPPPTRRASPRVRWPVFAAAALVVVAPAVGFLAVRGGHANVRAVAPAAASGYTPRVEPAQCESPIRADPLRVSCGVLVVPEDRTNPRGRWIRLEYRRYAASPTGPSDQTVVDVGDPPEPAPLGTTSPGLNDVDASGGVPALATRAGADFVVIASRGLYRSTPSLDCPEFDAVGPDVVSHAQGDPAVVAAGQRALRACYTRLVRAGIDPAHYRLADQAADVVDLLHALRLHSVDLTAGNDGALIAFDVAAMVPGVIRSIALLDPAAPEASFRADATTSLAAVFDRYVSLCQSDARCHRAYPDLGRLYETAYRDYSAHPRVAQQTGGLHIQGLLTGVPVHLDGGRVAQALAAVFEGDPVGLALLPAGIAHPSDVLDASLAASEQYPLLLPHFPWGGYLSRICNDESMGTFLNASSSHSSFPEFAGYDDPAFTWMCAAWRVPAIDASPTSPAVTAPMFVARMDLSPRQSTNAVDIIRAASPAVQVFELHVPTSLGVMGYFPHCFEDLRVAFERDPTRPLDTAGCERRESQIAFVTPAG